MISGQDQDYKVVTQMLIVAGEWTGATLSSEVYFILYISIKLFSCHVISRCWITQEVLERRQRVGAGVSGNDF